MQSERSETKLESWSHRTVQATKGSGALTLSKVEKEIWSGPAFYLAGCPGYCVGNKSSKAGIKEIN